MRVPGKGPASGNAIDGHRRFWAARALSHFRIGTAKLAFETRPRLAGSPGSLVLAGQSAEFRAE